MLSCPSAFVETKCFIMNALFGQRMFQVSFWNWCSLVLQIYSRLCPPEMPLVWNSQGKSEQLSRFIPQLGFCGPLSSDLFLSNFPLLPINNLFCRFPFALLANVTGPKILNRGIKIWCFGIRWGSRLTRMSDLGPAVQYCVLDQFPVMTGIGYFQNLQAIHLTSFSSQRQNKPAALGAVLLRNQGCRTQSCTARSRQGHHERASSCDQTSGAGGMLLPLSLCRTGRGKRPKLKTMQKMQPVSLEDSFEQTLHFRSNSIYCGAMLKKILFHYHA